MFHKRTPILKLHMKSVDTWGVLGQEYSQTAVDVIL